MDNAQKPNCFSTHIGISLQQITSEFTLGELAISDNHKNSLGIVHGGIYYTLADTVAGYGALATSVGKNCVTIDGSLNFLRAGKGGKLICTATPVRIGRTIAVMDTEIKDETGVLLAKGLFTFYIVDYTKA